MKNEHPSIRLTHWTLTRAPVAVWFADFDELYLALCDLVADPDWLTFTIEDFDCCGCVNHGSYVVDQPMFYALAENAAALRMHLECMGDSSSVPSWSDDSPPSVTRGEKDCRH